MKINEDGVSESRPKNLEILRGIKKTPEEANLALLELFEVSIPNSEKPIDKLFIASKSRTKQQLLAESLSTFGIEIISPNDDEDIPEEEYRKILEDLKTPAEKFSPRMSARKLTKFTELVRSGIPALAFDTVVVDTDDGQVIEKPRTIDEARLLLTQLTSNQLGKVLSVIDGVTFFMMSKTGTPLIWRGSANITFILKRLKQSEVDDYLKEQGNKVLEIAGGIDYASDSGKKLVNPCNGSPFGVSVGKVGSMPSLDETIGSEELFPQSVFVADSASSVLNPYFKGVPTHLVQGIIRNFSSKGNK